MSVWMMERVGDRGGQGISIKPIAFTVPANPMSDRTQLVLETYEEETDSNNQREVRNERGL